MTHLGKTIRNLINVFKDAKRYRWLKQHNRIPANNQIYIGDLDKIIDKLMRTK